MPASSGHFRNDNRKVNDMIFGAAGSRRPRNESRAAGRATSASSIPFDLPPKLIPSLKQFAATAGSLVGTRIALAKLELEEEMQRLIKAAMYGSVALVLVLLALVVATFTMVAAASEEHRVMTMIIITIVYLAIAVFLGLRVKALFSDRPAMFSATLAELDKDKETLTQMAKSHPGDGEFPRASARQSGAVDGTVRDATNLHGAL